MNARSRLPLLAGAALLTATAFVAACGSDRVTTTTERTTTTELSPSPLPPPGTSTTTTTTTRQAN